MRRIIYLCALCCFALACKSASNGVPPSENAGASAMAGSGGAGGAGGVSAGSGGAAGSAGGVGGASGVGGAGGMNAGSGGMQASGGTGGAPSDGGSSPMLDGSIIDAPDAMIDEPIFAPITDPDAEGPYGVDRIDRVEGLATHSLFVPSELALNGKNPVVIWTNGNGGTIDTFMYSSFIEHVASHGFFVIADKASDGTREAEVDSQGAAIDWAITENAKSGGTYFGRFDLERIAVMGHSLGSLASFATASNEHVRTSIHFSGGITDNPVGFDASWLQQMKQPAAFLCGGGDTMAGPSCEKDFAMAPAPVFYGVLEGASHIGPFFADPHAGEYGRAGVAWLRWQLAGDPMFRAWFVGADCVLCAGGWSAMQRDLDAL